MVGKKLLIWANPKNLVKIGLLVEKCGNFLQDGGQGQGRGRDRERDTADYIDNLSLSFGFGPRLWLGLENIAPGC